MFVFTHVPPTKLHTGSDYPHLKDFSRRHKFFPQKCGLAPSQVGFPFWIVGLPPSVIQTCDWIGHRTLFRVLLHHGVDHDYVKLVAMFAREQVGHIRMGRNFTTDRRVGQKNITPFKLGARGG